jgi:hypothetical protein
MNKTQNINLQENNQITILFEPGTFKIINIIDLKTGNSYLSNNSNKLNNLNVYDWAKSIKPSPSEFGNLSSLLMAIKNQMHSDEITYQFSNNGNFLTEYLLGAQYAKNINFNKFFWISYKRISNYHAINVLFTIKLANKNVSISIGPYIDTPRKNIFEHIRHELINPLNAIKISGDQIRKHIRQNNGQISPDDIDKFNNIILNQVDNSIDIIDTFTELHTQNGNNQQISFQKLSITNFKQYIQTQIEQINQTYFMFPPVQIEWSFNQLTQSEYIITHYVCISLSYMKIILDNIFRNIYGHLGNENKYLIANSSNKLTISVSGNKIELKIYNEIKQLETKINKSALRYNKSAQRIINKYDLFISDFMPISTNQYSGSGAINYQVNKQNRGIGLTLINNLCGKMDVKWHLIDNETNICFILSIPVLTDTYALSLFCSATTYQHKAELIHC